MKALRLLTLAGVGAVTLSACGGGARAADPPAMSSTPAPTVVSAPATVAKGPAAVEISGFAFAPAALSVPVGTKVTWTNRDEEPHTVVGSGLHSTVLGNAGSSYSYTFTKAGTYDYNCSIHPFMHGTVTVTG
jgi:plastocyanin